MPVFQADLALFPGIGFISGGWVSTDEQGLILATGTGTPPEPFTRLEGLLLPGFVNAHCHLELSYLRQRISEKSGMTSFISQLMHIRNNTGAEEQAAGISEAHEQMLQNGIVAVGDISNSLHTATIKKKKGIHFHTFVEVMGLASFRAQQILDAGKKLVHAFGESSCGLSPHAPYSVSTPLMHLVVQEVIKSGMPLTIHLQESLDEIEFCRTGNGAMGDLFRSLKIPFDDFRLNEEAPIRIILPQLKEVERILFVHNTFLSKEDLIWAESQHKGITWCLCPKANLYITGELPSVNTLREYTSNIAIGTDSLASNDKLDILDELKVLSRHFPSVPLKDLIQWATINGAKALLMENKVGSLEPGKTPGILLMQNFDKQTQQLTADTTVQKLV
jgi:aminodeoxyfutalosine deaminase